MAAGMIRRANAQDADAIAALFTAARAEHRFLPALHTAEDDRWFVRELMLPGQEVWVAEEDGSIVGFAALNDGQLVQLFVHPLSQGRGVGRTLLDKAKERRPAGFTLWTFQANGGARRFYEREGLVAIEFTDGAANEEKLPDVRYKWTPES
jgi:GNAT superfamily N-acetyltransferase